MTIKIINVRSKYGGEITSYNCSEIEQTIKINDWVIVDSEQGLALTKTTATPIIIAKTLNDKECNKQKNLTFYYHWLNNLRKLIRIATEKDIAHEAQYQVRESEILSYCQQRIKVQALEMHLVATEILFDGSKTIIYYTANDRIDFRLLVKELVSRFRIRIEMRQIGVRHESKMLGGIGNCGSVFCCSNHLNNFTPVSVKMAKKQNLSLNPNKISGLCGRLMCCLSYEYKNYLQKEKGLPSIGKIIETPHGEGRIIRQNIEDKISIVLLENGSEYELKHYNKDIN